MGRIFGKGVTARDRVKEDTLQSGGAHNQQLIRAFETGHLDHRSIELGLRLGQVDREDGFLAVVPMRL